MKGNVTNRRITISVAGADDSLPITLQPTYEFVLYQLSLASAYASSDVTSQLGFSLSSIIRPGMYREDKSSTDEPTTNGGPTHDRKIRMNWQDYLQIYNFVQQNDLSQMGADAMLSMLRDIHMRHKAKIPLPLNYKTILRCIENKSNILQSK